MIRLNKSTRFALYAMVELGRDPTAVLSAGEIAQKYQVSEHHMAKVMQQLVRSGLIRSIRGIRGGFQIARDPKEVTMFDVVRLFEPAVQDSGCLLLDGVQACELQETCRIGEVLAEIQEQAVYTLQSVSISTLVSPKRIS